MGFFEDSIEEFRKLPPAGKVAVGAAAVGVAILGYLSYRNGGGASAAAPASTSASDPLAGLGSIGGVSGLGGNGGFSIPTVTPVADTSSAPTLAPISWPSSGISTFTPAPALPAALIPRAPQVDTINRTASIAPAPAPTAGTINRTATLAPAPAPTRINRTATTTVTSSPYTAAQQTRLRTALSGA